MKVVSSGIKNGPTADSKDNKKICFGGWLYFRQPNGKIVNTGFNIHRATLKDNDTIYLEHMNIR